MQSTSLKTLNHEYSVINYLGDGNTSNVYKVRLENSPNFYAAKIFYSNEDFSNEINIYNKINGLPYIINCIDSGNGPSIEENSSSQNTDFLILEYASHRSLYDYIQNEKGLSEDTCKILLYDILKGVSALHERGICHKDIKPDNILLCGDNYQSKLIDFGYSESFLDENNQKIKLEKYYGTKGYYAPELYMLMPFDGEKADIFSLGATLFCLLTGKTIFDITKYPDDLYKLIIEKHIKKFWKKVKKIIDVELSQSFMKLFVKMVSFDPEKRLSLYKIRNSEWMQGVENLDRTKMINELKLIEEKF